MVKLYRGGSTTLFRALGFQCVSDDGFSTTVYDLLHAMVVLFICKRFYEVRVLVHLGKSSVGAKFRVICPRLVKGSGSAFCRVSIYDMCICVALCFLQRMRVAIDCISVCIESIYPFCVDENYFGGVYDDYYLIICLVFGRVQVVTCSVSIPVFTSVPFRKSSVRPGHTTGGVFLESEFLVSVK